AYYQDGSIDFIKPSDIQYRVIETFSEKLSESSRNVARLVPSGAVLVTCIGEIGRVGLTNHEVAFNQQINGIIPNNQINSRFLFYRLQLEKKQLESKSSATTVSILNKSKFSTIKITFPKEKDMQEKIVEAIETQFTRLDAAIKSLKAIKDKLELYRKSVLKEAFSVRNLTDCEIKKLGYFERKGGGTPSTKVKKYWGGNINWITSASINDKNNITFEKKITALGLKNSAANLVPKGSVIVVTRVGLGKVAVNEEPTAFSQDNQGIICKDINPYFLMWQIKSAANEIIGQGQGTTISGITVNKLNLIEVKVPDLDTQAEIVNLIESRLSVIDNLEKVIYGSFRKSKILRNSILKSAFEGKLI
ncbi:MAG: restriction endonuclease subunit S, partial [Candidatus Omnitrophota bacterium]